MTSEDGSPGQDPVDPAFDGLFRPEDVLPQVAEPAPEAQVADAAPPAPPVPPAPPEQPAPTQPAVDTGRLFRSQGVEDRSDAVLALDAGRFSRLRTIQRVTDDSSRAVAPEPTEADPAVAALLAPIPADSHPADSHPGAPVPAAAPVAASPSGESVSPRRRRQRPAFASKPSGPGASAGIAYVVVIAVTLLVGLANAFLGGGSLGWPTGLALLASSIYAAATVRRADDAAAFIIPPVAFLITALTAGQFFLSAGDTSLINRAVAVFFSLADNWAWIIGSTLVALVIVLVRRRRD
ncbi:MAG: hypothetical protein K9G24_11180 [Candidatus Nanopelagicales bacterium]|nr:hypothetical protein [Candidatus Nanopelagicales bacterium]MCF8543632.1 hypothetical protein [Candidatus Nanopelagicales bacterium]MCF8556821.1 hypothetical protein [Candidatus Nanopelagicales bacterium]